MPSSDDAVRTEGQQGWFRSHVWHFALVAGLAIVCVGLGAAHHYFYYLGPVRRLMTNSWQDLHNHQALYLECQRSIERGVWPHDTPFIIGRYGDKEWARRTVSAMAPAEVSGCASAHRVDAMQLLANQGLSVGSEWAAWWAKNEQKSQEDWIREGFAVRGIQLQSPLTPENTLALVQVLGYRVPKDRNDPPSDTPWYVAYNAFRWLRDNDFEAESFPLSSVPNESKDRALYGLIRYARLEGELPKHSAPGVLNLGKPVRRSSIQFEITSRKHLALAYSASVLPIVLGVGAVVVSLSALARRSRR